MAIHCLSIAGLIAAEDTQGKPVVEMPVEEFEAMFDGLELPDRSLRDVEKVTLRLHDHLWSRFALAKGKEKFNAALLISEQMPPVNVERRAELIEYLRTERKKNPNERPPYMSGRHGSLTLALSYLDQSDAEVEVLQAILLEEPPKRPPPEGGAFLAIDIRLSSRYFHIRSGKVYLVSRLHSSNRELRHVAWDVLKKFHDLPDDLAFEPEMSPDGQRVMLERLEKWSRENIDKSSNDGD